MLKTMKALFTTLILAGLLTCPALADKKLKKEKLQIVFLMGQSNMVGLADMRTARYLTEAAYVPPKEIVAVKSETFDWSNLYWQGIRTYQGPQKYKDQLNELYLERRLSRMKWRQRVNGQRGPWKEERGAKPEGKGRGVMYPYLDKKAEEEGVYQRMDEIIGNSENEFTMEAAYQEVIQRDKELAKAGYEIAGMVWFQGYSDQGNPAYGEQLVELVKFMRQKVKAPEMPFVAATLGMPAYQHMALEGDVNGGMVQAAQHPDMRGTFDVVNTAPYFPVELDMALTVRKAADKESPEFKAADAVVKAATSNNGFHYHGSAKCFLLMGDAMGRSLANLMAGGEPQIHAQIEK